MSEEWEQTHVEGDADEGDGWWWHLDPATAETLLETAQQRNAGLVQRLQAVETRAGTLVVFAGVVAGLLVGRDTTDMALVGAIAVVLAVAAAALGAVVASCAAIGFWWPEPRSSSMALHDSGERPRDALLEEEVVRGEHNHGTIRAREVWLRAAAGLLVLSLVLAAVDWGRAAMAESGEDGCASEAEAAQDDPIGATSMRSLWQSSDSPCGAQPAPLGTIIVPTEEAAMAATAWRSVNNGAPSEVARLRREVARLSSAPHFETAKRRVNRHRELRRAAAELKQARLERQRPAAR